MDERVDLIHLHLHDHHPSETSCKQDLGSCTKILISCDKILAKIQGTEMLTDLDQILTIYGEDNNVVILHQESVNDF